MIDHQLTFVGRLDGRIIDEACGDPCTSIATLKTSALVLTDTARFERGLPSLIQAAHQQAGIHFGLLGLTGEVEGVGVMHCSPDRVETAVIGRHSHADARGGASSFALRHALLVRPKAFDDTLRIFDLAGGGGTTTLSGTPIDAATMHLPCVLRLGSYLFVAFKAEHRALGAAGIIELSAATLVRENIAGEHANRFVFTMDDLSSVANPRQATKHFRVDTEFPPTGEIEITRIGSVDRRPPLRQIVFRPDRDALARGFLLGRYGRCGAPANITWDDKMSRVHALLFAINDDVYVADLGSTNGTQHAEQGDLRLKHIENGDEFLLGDTRLRAQELRLTEIT